MDKQQRELYSISCNKPYGKEQEKNVHIYIQIYMDTHTHTYINESLYCTAEINTTL